MATLGAVLPVLNACLNGLAALLLLAGLWAIRSGRREVHRQLMVSAFVTSSVFLASYLLRFALFGSKKFPGAGAWKALYLTILFSHMLLAMAVVPLVLRTLYLALRGRFAGHQRLARITFPVWMYVSVTGVVVYAMLYHFPAGR